MRIHLLEQEQLLPITPEQAWSFFSTPGNLDAITPDDLGFQITSAPREKMFEGQIITYRVKIAPAIWVPWVTEIKSVDEGRSFIDEQRFGPYKFWHHRHHFEASDGGVLMTDQVHYALPFGPIGEVAHAVFVRRKLEWIFAFRRRALEKHFGNPQSAPQGGPAGI